MGGVLKQTECYLKSLIGKTFMRPYRNGKFILFKVMGHETVVYLERKNSPSRYFRLKFTQFINCSVKDSSGRYFRPGVKYTNLQFNKITGKNKNKVETSDLDLIDYSTERYSYLPSEVSEFGKISYDSGIPNFKNDLSTFSLFLREVPEAMWKDAKKIADENIIKTKLFWDKYEPLIKNQ